MVEPANEKTRIDSTEQLLRNVPVAFADPDEVGEDVTFKRKPIPKHNQVENNNGDVDNKLFHANYEESGLKNHNHGKLDGKINRAYTSPDIELNNYTSIVVDNTGECDTASVESGADGRTENGKGGKPMSVDSGTLPAVAHARLPPLHSSDDEAVRILQEDGGTRDDTRHKDKDDNKPHPLGDIGADFMRVNGAIGSFKQLQKPTSMQSLPTSSKMSYTSDDAQVGLVQNDKGEKYGMDDGKQKKENKPNVGYRLGKRKTLYERRKKISDYCLVFGMIGITLMILETELTMAAVYTKVSGPCNSFVCSLCANTPLWTKSLVIS